MSLQNAGDFNATGVAVAVPAGTTNAPGRAVLASRVLPSGAKAILEKWSAKVIDIGNSDQVYFVITKNSAPIQSGMERIPAIQFDYQSQIDLNVLIGPGLIEVVAYNISGMSATIEPNANVAVSVSCQAWWSGSLVNESKG